MDTDITTEVLILGAGTAGLYALREVRRAGRDFRLVDQGPLGTTCARVGCMPSKVALHAAAHWASREGLAGLGVDGADALTIDLRRTWAALRAERDRFAQPTAARARESAGERLVEGTARFVAPTVVDVGGPAGRLRIRAESVVIATGSRPVLPEWLAPVRDRTITTDELFELESLPGSIGVLGMGAIGLEMGLALSRLGVRVVGADVASTVAGIVDPVLAERAVARFGREIELHLGAAAAVSRGPRGVLLRTAAGETEVDLVLAALGRRPNTDALGLAEAGLPVDARGNPRFDPATMQVGSFPVFIAGDANADRPLMHEAVDEGAIAGHNACRATPLRFARKVPLGIAFTDPDVISVGTRFDGLDPAQTVVGTAGAEANGRSRILGAGEGLVRVYAQRSTGRLLGASMMAVRGEHLAHLLAWAIQRGETARSALELPFYHPVVEELLQSALQDVVRQLPPTADPALPVGLALAAAA